MTRTEREFQSTHPHGVRLLVITYIYGSNGFNPRTHTGCDLQQICNVVLFALFQSTHPHGVRPSFFGRSLSVQQCFNPRTHTGCDLSFKSLFSFSRGFNPRTHTGCDITLWSKTIVSYCFNPRTHTGCDCIRGYRLPLSYGFNPRTHTGCDYLIPCHLFYSVFQSTHPHGVRPVHYIGIRF